MSTTVDPKSSAPPDNGQPEAKAMRHLEMQEIRLYSHSDIFYWWPVWALGFVLAFLSYLDGSRMALVPEGTQARRDWRVEVSAGALETREALVLPRATAQHPAHLVPVPRTHSSLRLPPPEQPHVRMARNPYLGTCFMLTILVVFISTHAPLRGLWEWIAVLVIALVVTVIGLYGWWGSIADWFLLLHIRINAAGYLFLSSWLFAIWLVTTFYFDHLTYMIFSAGQVRIRQTIGEGEKAFDVTNMNMELQPNVFIRHRILGFYDAGDLVVRTGGARPEVFHWNNVLHVRSKLRKIERLLQTREVD
jgi:hypothetical protein